MSWVHAQGTIPEAVDVMSEGMGHAFVMAHFCAPGSCLQPLL